MKEEVSYREAPDDNAPASNKTCFPNASRRLECIVTREQCSDRHPTNTLNKTININQEKQLQGVH